MSRDVIGDGSNRGTAPGLTRSLRAKLAWIVDDTVDHVQEQIPEYRNPSDDVLQSLRSSVQTGLSSWLDLVEAPPPAEAELVPKALRRLYEELGRTAARAGFSPEAVVAIPMLCQERLWTHVEAAGLAVDQVESAGLAGLQTGFVRILVGAISKGCFEGLQEPQSAIVARLLGDASSVSLRELEAMGLAPAPAYRVATLTAWPRGIRPENLSGARAPHGCLVGSFQGLRVAILPTPEQHSSPRLRELLSEIQGSHGGQPLVCVGSPYPGAVGIEQSWREARAVHRAARRFCSRGVVLADESAIPVALASSALSGILARPLEPLLELAAPEISLQTLRVYLETGCSRRKSREILQLSKSGLAHRLEKIENRLGMPIRPNALTLQAALIVHEWQPAREGG